ncbi:MULTISPECIES: hypothetical protein [Staphylococcus]|uniref:hypothetical protein n=1 Tax=Staphylococcus TaxID=1279 RepID=UPI001DD8408F|nr:MULTISPECIES: hypothetical protein [Staphylococcus]MDU8984942.1 hypothetical protein [Staphylococcus epidermidis]NAM31057.1 hypothetical protein [Staphylococcus epidermidis]NAM67927.1 hypothetical protein [Staphylococcus epidermidis]NAM79732.1 hypothetical protein [Staphylococcus epidermidis]NAM82091.1 hypothetical protein [Staphylococcus epidermidis]
MVHFICLFIIFCIFGYVIDLIFFKEINIFLILESAFILSLLIMPILKIVKEIEIEKQNW